MENPVIAEINQMVAQQVPDLNLEMFSPKSKKLMWILVGILVIVAILLGLQYYRKSKRSRVDDDGSSVAVREDVHS